MINVQESKLFFDYINQISGIHLDQSKLYLLETRLSDLLKEYRCSSYFEFFQKAKLDKTKTLEQKIIDSISTNETSFFRDTSPFEALRLKILPDLIKARTQSACNVMQPSIRIWSAACSTGQEIYSIAMILKEYFSNFNKINFYLIGTDISNAAIAKASYGEYNKFEVERGLAKNLLHKYFTAKGINWKIKDELRAMVTFKKLNLLQSLDVLGKFDIIFCRNIAIYFTLEDRKNLFYRMKNLLQKDGYLIIGSTESLTNIYNGFEPKRLGTSVVYQIKD